MKNNVVVYGAGFIGSRVAKALRADGYKVFAEVHRTHATLHDGSAIHFERPGDTVEIMKALEPICAKAGVRLAVGAMPSDDGAGELRVAIGFLGIGANYGTASKAMLAEHFDQMYPYIEDNRVGYRAACGGASSMLHDTAHWLKRGGKFGASMIANGTMAFMGSCMEHVSLDEAARRAMDEHYAEPLKPGETFSLQRLYGAEVADVVGRKVPIAVSTLCRQHLGRACRPSDIAMQPFTEDDLRSLHHKHGAFHYVAHLGVGEVPAEAESEKGNPGSIYMQHENVYVRGGFRHLEETDVLYLRLPRGPGNVLIARQNGQTRVFSGIGAGEETVWAVMQDVRELCPLQ